VNSAIAKRSSHYAPTVIAANATARVTVVGKSDGCDIAKPIASTPALALPGVGLLHARLDTVPVLGLYRK